ncbi:MAG: FmdE, Molybdenum formylmethanofuran dehydrogenase operon [Methanomassiliicoccales archaeon PtaU1.Bin124]|nr:MAG: FmdE, Molybdenum formylmethanofuran dehydrogenase operon [Methanomassiliicoccales archaeon PtaU1.Bin124]
MHELPPELEALKQFHGHLGPYVVVGYRMGKLARAEMKGKLKAVAYSKRPPVSCLVDGIQFTSGCTLGKGNIEVLDDGIPKAIFRSADLELTLELKDEVRRDVDAQMTHETEEMLALSIFRASTDSLFTIKRSTPCPPGR